MKKKNIHKIVIEEMQSLLDPNWMISYKPDGYQHNILDENQNVMGIQDLAEMVSRLGVDFEIALEILQDQFKKFGDAGVIEMFKGMTDVAIEPIRRGKYVFNYRE
jgi:hypothetical protein